MIQISQHLQQKLYLARRQAGHYKKASIPQSVLKMMSFEFFDGLLLFLFSANSTTLKFLLALLLLLFRIVSPR
jgi:hypothetical protein